MARESGINLFTSSANIPTAATIGRRDRMIERIFSIQCMGTKSSGKKAEIAAKNGRATNWTPGDLFGYGLPASSMEMSSDELRSDHLHRLDSMERLPSVNTL